MKTIDKNFNWGTTQTTWIDNIVREIFEEKQYEKIYQVQENDVVLDIGASVGPFTYSVLDRASKIYSLEPMNNAYNILKSNFSENTVEPVNSALFHSSGFYKFPMDGSIGSPCVHETYDKLEELFMNGEVVNTLSFMEFVKKYNIEKIDFIKTDSEGGEYYLFREENMEFLLNNVRNIVGEFHLITHEQKVEFRYFRDKFLKKFKEFTVLDVNGVDITWSVFKDKPYDSISHSNLEPFIDYYQLIYIHISN